MGEVGKARGSKVRAVDAELVEGVRRHLHRDGGRAGIPHPREQRLQVCGLRCRVLQLERRVVDPGADRPHDTGSVPRGPGDGFEQVGRGRLAIRARDTEHTHRA